MEEATRLGFWVARAAIVGGPRKGVRQGRPDSGGGLRVASEATRDGRWAEPAGGRSARPLLLQWGYERVRVDGGRHM